jgi:hypothetical protein
MTWADDEANIITDDPATNSTPFKLGVDKQLVRKSFLHQSWSAMNLASEIAGSDALARIQTRVSCELSSVVMSGDYQMLQHPPYPADCIL